MLKKLSQSSAPCHGSARRAPPIPISTTTTLRDDHCSNSRSSERSIHLNHCAPPRVSTCAVLAPRDAMNHVDLRAFGAALVINECASEAMQHQEEDHQAEHHKHQHHQQHLSEEQQHEVEPAQAQATPSPPVTHAPPPKRRARAPLPGSTVVGTVVFTNSKGSKVRLRGGAYVGYMPADQGPIFLPATTPDTPHHDERHHLVSQQQQEQPAGVGGSHPHHAAAAAAAHADVGGAQPALAASSAHKPRSLAEKREVFSGVLPLGVTREFVVMSMPTDGRGPLLSAALADHQVVMKRALHLQDMLWQTQRPIKARVTSVSPRGCHCEVPGLCGPQAFLPWNLVANERGAGRAAAAAAAQAHSRDQLHQGQHDDQGHQQQVAAAHAPPSTSGAQAHRHSLGVGDEVDVLLHTVDADTGKIILSERDVMQEEAPALHPGQLVTGHVQEVHPWGVSVALQGVLGQASAAQVQGQEALLSVQRVTRLPDKPCPQAVFQAGDPITALVVYTGRCLDHRGAALAMHAMHAPSGGAGQQQQHQQQQPQQHQHYQWDRKLQVELSLMELEQQDGDMLYPEARQACFAAAAAAAATHQPA